VRERERERERKTFMHVYIYYIHAYLHAKRMTQVVLAGAGIIRATSAAGAVSWGTQWGRSLEKRKKDRRRCTWAKRE
jgi:hypothetical protein